MLAETLNGTRVPGGAGGNSFIIALTNLQGPASGSGSGGGSGGALWNEESAYLNSQPGYLEVSIQKTKSVSTKPPKSDQSGGENHTIAL